MRRARKVKCDEQKPECHRCVSTGRKCDGYQQLSNTPSPSNNILQIHSDLFASQTERRSFDYFQTRACQDLGRYFHFPFWSREVLQAAIHFPPIRHLVIALGAAYESFTLEGSNEPNPHESAAGMQFALQQSNHSIRHMHNLFQSASTNGQSLESTCCILTASILFTYLSSLQGYLGQAIEHIRSGLKLLQDFDASPWRQEASNPAYPVPIELLRSILIAMYGQVRCMINDEALTKWDRDLLVCDVEPVFWFSSVADAHNYVESLFQNMLAFLQTTEFNPPRTPDQLAAFQTRRNELLRALKSSCEALELLSSHQSLSAGSHPVENGITILRLYHTLIEMRLRMDALRPDKREATFDALEPQLEKMLEYCGLLVNDDPAGSTRALCHSGLGIVMPLHTVAARCRNPQLRRKALDMLLKGARRECLWDGIMTGKIAAKTLEIEEQRVLEEEEVDFSSAEELRKNVPDERRVREVKIEFHGERKARLQFITVGNWKRNETGVQHVIEW
ncbi:uncharacterized protein Z518_01331 [Rhinocladiella mackenziei CBS 650.93]|uniref:Zn(2)-C6 fungal-type domain-containing protein n=1 Tax=Rhinocladiella mackenziei CBS 650.93 TaxID=1442369 RepID=A0A0D2JLB3_9EURO|nr:uncharacterized protein Z518_01331 [Rhinocladiella mackenziei CBS 650.93]KIX10250.1 hypothetical protein Z518_01331 [Rhinocladiella mackenziei CBS 650.93]